MNESLREKVFIAKGEIVAGSGTFTTKRMPAGFENAELAYITFYSDEYVNRVTPTAGTVDVTLTPNDYDYRVIDNGSFPAASAYDPIRVSPNAWGLATKGKVTLTGVDAAYCKAAFWRS